MNFYEENFACLIPRCRNTDLIMVFALVHRRNQTIVVLTPTLTYNLHMEGSDNVPATNRTPNLSRSFSLFFVLIFTPLIQDLVDQTHLQGLLGAHELISLHQPLNIVQSVWFGQMPLVYLIQLSPHPQNLLRVDRDVTRLPKIPSARLMYHDTGMW